MFSFLTAFLRYTDHCSLSAVSREASAASGL
jgi:hypothetical protein